MCRPTWRLYIPRMPTSPGPLLQALATAWERVREDVGELPPAQPTISTPPLPLDHGPERWSTGDNGSLLGLAVSADTLQAGAQAVVEHLRHEAAHLLAWKRGIKDTTMRGGYHNASFLALAEEVGLSWSDGKERSASRGFYNPALTDEARQRHVDDIAALDAAIPPALPLFARPASRSTRPDRLSVQCECDPPRKGRFSKTAFELGPIICGVCKAEFKEAP